MTELTVRCTHAPRRHLTLSERELDDMTLRFCVDVRDDELDVHVHAVEFQPWDIDGLPGLVDGLLADFTGWTGERRWQGEHLDLAATFHSGGHIRLKWTVRPTPPYEDAWELSLFTWVEAGEGLRQLAGDVRAFFDRRR